MAFESLTDRLAGVFKKLRGHGKLTEADIKAAMREVRMALLEADVNYKVAKDFCAKVSERAMGQEVMESLTPAQQVVKIVNEELVALMGGSEAARLNIKNKGQTIIMLCGLQGNGKTTHAAKLAKYFIKQGRRPMLVACDIYRPAAIDQLQVVGKQAGAPVFTLPGAKPPEIAKKALAHAKDYGNDIVILDTAGRLHIDEALMEELSGNWSLPERPLGTNELDDSLDFIDKPCGYYESAPALDLEELRSFHAAATRMRGRKAAETAVKYAVGGSRSPMEAIMNCVFALPHEYGGLNCRPVETNRKIAMDETAHALSGLPYVIADAYLPRFNTILEYNGSYHDDATIRRRDEARTLGLMSMGIDVYRLNSDQLRDPNALEAIARMIYRRSGRFFRPRAKCYQQKHLQLLNGLRKAFGLN